MSGKAKKTDEEWEKEMSSKQFEVMRKKGTEPAFSGKYYNCNEDGTYVCAACSHPLFSSYDKFDSGTGWPSFCNPIDSENLIEKEDNGLLSKRTEIICSNCDSHLGHVFNDGPSPTNQRYCINSVCLGFVEEK